MASLTGQTISSTYDGLLKTVDNDVLTLGGKVITDGLGNSTGVTLDTNGNVIADGNLKATGGIKDSSDNLGTNGQVLSSTGAGTNWIDSSIPDDSITYAKLGTEFTTSEALTGTTLDFSSSQIFTNINSGNVTYTVTNADVGMVKDFILTGTGSFSITGGKLIAGTFTESTTNFIQIVAQSSSVFWYSISQEQ